ncbi:MAG TPA: tetratricopeptide repeat protein [Polyangiaceae bacterium]|nr:tetratricopeptide repeat protein [Polyangiaceae bacterium]
MGNGPLDHPGLRRIEQHLDHGELQDAQKLLSSLEDAAGLRHGLSYLTTRLLFERGRLDAGEVAQRLRDLLKLVAPFPEAQTLLASAEGNALQRASASGAASAEPVRAAAPDAQSIDALFKSRNRPSPSLPRIPKAPGLPNFTPSPDDRPSYAPPKPIEDAIPSLLPHGLPFAHTHPHLSDEERARETTRPPQTNSRRIRSGPPPALDEGATPSVIDIAALLDEARYAEALECIERTGSNGPDQQLLRARALHGEGRRKEATLALVPLCSAPLLEPELRGSCARLLIELDELEQALEQSDRAHHDEPDSPFLRLTLAWAKLRVARRSGERRLIEEAEQLLEGIQAHNLPLPALVLSLRACVQAHIGDPDEAMATAERALATDSRSADAAWAMGVAAARLGRPDDAKQAFLRLLNLSLVEARLLRRELNALGAPITDAPRAPHLEFMSQSARLWHPYENALVAGERSRVASGMEEMCRVALAELNQTGKAHDFPAVASVAANLFSRAPIWHHFAPFDLSLWSMPRVAAVLDLIYGPEPSAIASDDAALIQLVGSYIGETLRQTRGGTWLHEGGELLSAAVECDRRQWRPFELVVARLRRGMILTLGQAPSIAGGATPWNHRVQIPVSPPVPWGEAPWPDPSRIEQIARAVIDSVVGVYSRQMSEGPLDLSIESLGALDRYLALVAPLEAVLDENPVWARRLAVLIGAYLGETLRELMGGRWVTEDCAQVHADRYVVVLANSVRITPIAQVMSRVTGDSDLTLIEYASRLFHKLTAPAHEAARGGVRSGEV